MFRFDGERRFIEQPSALTIASFGRSAFFRVSSPVTDSLFHIAGRYAIAGALMLYAVRYLEATVLPVFMKGFLASFAFVYFL